MLYPVGCNKQDKTNYCVPASKVGLGGDWKNRDNNGRKVTLVAGLVLEH